MHQFTREQLGTRLSHETLWIPIPEAVNHPGDPCPVGTRGTGDQEGYLGVGGQLDLRVEIL